MPTLRIIPPDDAPALLQLATLYRESRRRAMSWLPVKHKAKDDLELFTDKISQEQELWGAFEGDKLLGFVAWEGEWINYLYVAPTEQRKGVGSQLLDKALEDERPKKLYSFEQNKLAAKFFESKGFAAIANGDGSDNEEGFPDVLYAWGRAEG